MVVVAAALAAVVGCAACQRPGGGGGPTPSGTQTAGSTVTGTPPASAEPASAEPTAQVLEFRVRFDWAKPAPEVVVDNHVVAPIASAPGLPLPNLAAIYAGNHPDETPRYQRMSFYFKGTFPSYRIGYVPAVLTEAKGDAIPLQGNAFLRVGFSSAQAHDNSGVSTVSVAPTNPIGLPTLRSYGFAGDFEGYVSYGLGLQVAPGSDQVLRIRVGELKRSDRAGGFYYVVFVDVENP